MSTSTEVIYARVPVALKHAADTYASQQGKTLTAAVVDLLDRGLSAASDEQSINDLRMNLVRMTAEKAAAEGQLATAQAQLATLGMFAERAEQQVGTCPNPKCGKPITSHDLFVASRCPHCAQPLTELLAPKTGAASTLDQRELLLFAGALGAVLAIAYLFGKK